MSIFENVIPERWRPLSVRENPEARAEYDALLDEIPDWMMSSLFFKTHADTRMAVFDFIEGSYNPHRRHSGIDYLSPMNYELRAQREILSETLQASTEPG